MADIVTFDYDGYGETLDKDTRDTLALDAENAGDTDEFTDVQRHEGRRAKVRRLVVLRGSHTSEISGPPIMETR